MGLLAWGISCVLLLVTGWRIARRVAPDAHEAFFITIVAIAAQVGAVCTILSWFDALNPAAALITQFIFLLIAFLSTPTRSKAKGRIVFPRLLLVLLPIILLTAIEQFILPVSNIDDRNYRASRAAYWLDHQSLRSFPTYNDRQIAFPPGGSLPFLWAILFTRSETPGLLATWIAYPLATIAVFILIREMRQSRAVATLGAALFAFTPVVLSHTRGLAPEMWLTFFTLAGGFWMLRAMREGAGAQDSFFAVLSAVFACAVRVTALPLLVMALILVLLARRNSRTIVAGATAIAVGLLSSGLLPMLVDNIRQFHHPLGSAPFRHVHSAELSVAQLRTHAARAILVLVEPPFAGPAAGLAWNAAQLHVLRLLHADAPLPMEDQRWPGRFEPRTTMVAQNYSLAGIALVMAALIAAAGAVIALLKRAPLSDIHVLALLALPFFLSTMFLIRWSGMMGRFWIAPLALCVPILVTMIARATGNRRAIRVAAGVLAGIVIVPAAIARTIDFVSAIRNPSPQVALDEPYFEPLAHIPDGSTILLIAGQATRDYPLFRPRDGFTNSVVPWGATPFDETRMRELFSNSPVTHVLIENDQSVDFHWYPPLATSPFVDWLLRTAGIEEIPLQYSSRMRLFKLR